LAITRTDSRRGTVAGGPVGDGLAAAEAAVGQEVVEVGSVVADQMCEHLALCRPADRGMATAPSGRLQSRDVGHVCRQSSEAAASSIAPRRPTVNRMITGSVSAPVAPSGCSGC
jgi:hypothetical protein